MTDLHVGSRVRVVCFDELGVTGSVYKGSMRSPVGHNGTVVGYEPEFRECPWVVDLDGSADFLMPSRFMQTELEVLDD